MRFWLFVVVFAAFLVLAVGGFVGVSGSNVLIVVTLPKSFTVTGPYARLLYDALNVPYGARISLSILNRPSVRAAWHVDYLTLIMPNGSKIAIEAKAQVIQVKIGNK